MKKPTVVEITGVMNCGGAELMLMNILRRLHKDFHFVVITLVNDPKNTVGEFDDEIRALGAELIPIETVRKAGVRAFEKKLTELLRKLHPEVTHCHLNSKCGIVAKCAHRAGVKKIISHSHARLKFRGNPLSVAFSYAELYWERGMINRYSTDFWGCSDDALRSLYSAKNRERAKVVYNLLDADRFTRPQEEKVEALRDELGLRDKTVLGLVGRIAPVKNYLFAVDVLAKVAERCANVRLLIVGARQMPRYAEELTAKIKEMGLEENVILLPPRQDIEAVYPLMQLWLGTSIREGASLTAIEAQLCGCRTMVSNGYLEMVDLGVGLFRRQPDFSAERWADDILEWLQKPAFVPAAERREALIAKGFDLETEIDKIKTEYAAVS